MVCITYHKGNNSMVCTNYNYIQTMMKIAYIKFESDFKMLETVKKFLMFLNPVEIVIDCKLNHPDLIEMFSNLPKSILVSKIKIKDQLSFLTLPQIIRDLNHGNESLNNLLENNDE